VFIEVNGKIQRTGIRFRDNQQLLNISSASSPGRRAVDESSPICDARPRRRLARSTAIVPPLRSTPALTIANSRRQADARPARQVAARLA